MSDKSRPYKHLGEQIKKLRENRFESLPEVSGALEIDTETLVKIERGMLRPSEETLLLLVTHFGVREDQAGKLWTSAGYPKDKITEADDLAEGEDPKPMVMVISDPRIVYTDSLQVMVNKHGLVLNFMQGGNSSQPPTAIARVGMSREHAQSVLELLKKTLQQDTMQIKQLPAPKKTDN